MAILVTGGAGFIGSHTVLLLLNHGYDVIVVDNCCNAVIEESVDLPESLKRVEKLTGRNIVSFHRVDLLNLKSLDVVFSQHHEVVKNGQKSTISAVIHLAALKAVGESCQLPLVYYENNVLGTINLIKTMKSHGVSNFIFSSSATVYGKPNQLPIDEEHETGRNITNPYGMSKFFTEQILKDEVTAISLNKNPSKAFHVISLRYFNPVGAHESGEIGEDPKGIPNNLMPFITQVAVGRRPSLSVFGSNFDTHDGTGVRDYIHIMDLASGHLAALKRMLDNQSSKASSFEVFNLGSGKGHSVLDVVEAFSRASGVKIPYKIVDAREGDVDAVYADCKKAKEVLSWQTNYSLEDMCRDAWRWQSKYPQGFSSEMNNNSMALANSLPNSLPNSLANSCS